MIPDAPARILVIDDDPGVSRMFQDLLQSHGYRVTCAGNGEDGLQAAESDPPDLILLDILMPKIDGMTVLMRLKSSPKTTRVPVVMLTALQQGEDVERALRLGAAHYIVKPVRTRSVIDRLREILEA